MSKVHLTECLPFAYFVFLFLFPMNLNICVFNRVTSLSIYFFLFNPKGSLQLRFAFLHS